MGSTYRCKRKLEPSEENEIETTPSCVQVNDTGTWYSSVYAFTLMSIYLSIQEDIRTFLHLFGGTSPLILAVAHYLEEKPKCSSGVNFFRAPTSVCSVYESVECI